MIEIQENRIVELVKNVSKAVGFVSTQSVYFCRNIYKKT